MGYEVVAKVAVFALNGVAEGHALVIDKSDEFGEGEFTYYDGPTEGVTRGTTEAEAKSIAWAMNSLANGDVLVAMSEATWLNLRARGENVSRYNGPGLHRG